MPKEVKVWPFKRKTTPQAQVYMNTVYQNAEGDFKFDRLSDREFKVLVRAVREVWLAWNKGVFKGQSGLKFHSYYLSFDDLGKLLENTREREDMISVREEYKGIDKYIRTLGRFLEKPPVGRD